jgi:(E)-4-hydroxy-3-methylbut-2-enyl-diphosphate synthase
MVGKVSVGNFSRISIQSMLKRPLSDFEGNVAQALELERAGCDILRVAVLDVSSVKLISLLKERLNIPIVSDIHFDYRLALESIAAGADKIRINPGNIGDAGRIKKLVSACANKGIPIRIGVNSGSLPKKILKKYGGPTSEAMCESASDQVKLLESLDFTDIIISVKSSRVCTMIRAYEMISERCDYPLHLGVTEAGCTQQGIVKSACGIGSLLARGIGDTIRVTLTDDPLKEVSVAKDLLLVLGVRKVGIEIISCPSCGRTKVDLINLVNRVKEHYQDYDGKNLKLAIMGCAVNGPAEAKEADLGVACGDGEGVIFKKGRVIKKISEEGIFKELIEQVKSLN